MPSDFTAATTQLLTAHIQERSRQWRRVLVLDGKERSALTEAEQHELDQLCHQLGCTEDGED